MPRLKLTDRRLLFLSVPIVLFIILWSAVFRKSDADICREILIAVSRPDDVTLIVGNPDVDTSNIRAKKIFFADTYRVSFLRTELRVEMHLGGNTTHYRESAPEGRVLIFSPGEAPLTAVGLVTNVPVGDSLLSLIHPIDTQESRWELLPFFPTAKVRRKGKLDFRIECPLKGDAFVCGRDDWMDVKVMQLPFNGVWQRCIFAHPLTDSSLIIEFPVPQDTSTLTLSGGIDDSGVAYLPGTPVKVDISSEGRHLGNVLFHNTPGFFTESIQLSENIPGGSDLTLEITTENQDTRHFCFQGSGVK